MTAGFMVRSTETRQRNCCLHPRTVCFLSEKVLLIREITPCVCGRWQLTTPFCKADDYVTLHSYDGKVEHYRVRRNKKEWVTVDDEEYFETLFTLVEV